MKAAWVICVAAILMGPVESFGAEAPGQQEQASTAQAQAATGAVNPSGVYVGNDPAEIAATDTIITQIIPLQSQSAAEMLITLAAFVAADTPMAASVGANAIIITERSVVVKRVVQIISLLDKPNENEIEVVRLSHADAAEAARLVNAVLGGR